MATWSDYAVSAWPTFVAAAFLLASATASGHAVLWKRDTRATIAWVGLIWLVPGVGVLLYVLLGINRLRRKATQLQALRPSSAGAPNLLPPPEDALSHAFDPHHVGLAKLAQQMTRLPLTPGNLLEPLQNGDEAYPAMLAAIDAARVSVSFCSFIFDNDDNGRRFIAALVRAKARGAEVRVLVDGVGTKYSWPPIHWALKKAGLPVARFLPTLAPAKIPFFNLRNHRKVMVVDGKLAFTGGMNIRGGHILGAAPAHPVRDVHFRVQGPVVAQLQQVFADDWFFCTREALSGPVWFPTLQHHGPAAARAIADGPDEQGFDVLRTVILGALAVARSRVRIVTPYFLPDSAMIAALAVAAYRGVTVDILLPSRCNITLVQWASTALLWQVLAPGCRVFLSPAPFDHTKLMVVDEAWVLLGSTNWDPRSLRLNFELNVEVYEPSFAQSIDRLIGERIAVSRPLSLADLASRSLAVRLRDGMARLLSPYL